MPIYEYECLACGALSSHIVMGARRSARPTCSNCESKRTRRVMSSFAVHASEGARLDSFDPRGPRDDAFYKDS